MNKGLSLCAIILLFFACNKSSNTTTETDIVKNNFDFASTQLEYALEELKLTIANESEASIHERAINNWSELTNPRSLEPTGELTAVPSKDWCSGFFPGELWFMYEYTKNDKWKNLAHRQTIIIEREKMNNRTHDMGFKMYCSYGQGYRLTNDSVYKNVLIESAKTLSTRFNPTVGCIRSWDFDTHVWDYPVIIDNMLNLELLFWATKATGDSTYYKIAESHAKTTMKNHFRANSSCYHVIDYNPQTGEVRKRNTHQGYSDESSWSRGQVWAVYGYTMMYRETRNKDFLEQAKRTNEFIFSNKNLPEDLIPYCDFDSPKIPNESRDASAAACLASALYELSTYDKENAKTHLDRANTIIENLTKNYRSELKQNKGFLLLHSTGSAPHNSEIDVPLVYADYYFLEALLRKQKLEQTGKIY